MSTHETTSPSKRHKHPSPANHYYSYIASILLTMIAFLLVMYGGLDKTFLYGFLLFMALIQVTLQLAYWMHMKEKGHLFPIIGIIFGGIVALTAVAAAVFWMWW
ncbi:cytochrome C oxidase subunit IV family protein [Paenibacillus lutrae]|uniref:Cytochrome C oxidase subunit IV n=1 Tax=Paenibacillus lutrae TaxID=2078573 RepID=A0A7X3FHJ4_9BACL|nr:cytochrome C oxidase subunit IV family protein [Paenibacillus lutrae]MVO99869.1 cytochrome C oxidase subunit IV [Paenibacillus lutrae]